MEGKKPELINDKDYLQLKADARAAHHRIKTVGQKTYWRLVNTEGDDYRAKLDRGPTGEQKNYIMEGDFWINQGAAGAEDFWDFLKDD